MIYRKWSLLTGPAAILAGVVGTVVIADTLGLMPDILGIEHKKQEYKKQKELEKQKASFPSQ